METQELSPLTPLHPDIIKDYQELKSLRQVGMKYGVSHQTINNILEKNGVPKFPVGRIEALTPEDQKHICQQYNKTPTPKQQAQVYKLADKFDVGPPTIIKVLKKNGYKISRYRKYTLDLTAFDTLDAESAKWLGYLYGRGNPKSEYHLELVYTKLEQEKHIEGLKEFLGTNQPIKQIQLKKGKKSYTQNRLVIGSRELILKLETLGLKPVAKISYPEFISQAELDAPFIRGYFNARGHKYQYQYKDQKPTYTYVNVSSNYLFITELNEVVQKLTKAKGNVAFSNFNPHYGYVRYYGLDAQLFLDFIGEE